IAIEVDDRGCAYGYCRPESADDERTAWIARSTDGDKVVLTGTIDNEHGGDADVAHVLDARSRAHLRTLKLNGDDGITNDLDGLAFVGQVLFVRGNDAGPWAGVWAFSAGEVPLV